MSSNRFALIIANDQYEDESLSKLEAPKFDAYTLAEVLGDPDICNFYVQLAVNKNSYTVNQLIEAFFDKRKRDDLLLLYFSGHGVKDEDGRLYFATPNTRRDRLFSTGVSASMVNELMRKTRSRRQILLLDCCYSGAFAKGMIAKSGSAIGSTVGTNEQFQGRGRIVLTASDSMQYAFEEDKLVEEGSVNSIFTGAIVDGIRTWEADSNGDNRISIHELYDYVDGYVQDRTPNQQPVMWSFNIQGEMIIAERKYAPLVMDEEVEVYVPEPRIPEEPQPPVEIIQPPTEPEQPPVEAEYEKLELKSQEVQPAVETVQLHEEIEQQPVKVEQPPVEIEHVPPIPQPVEVEKPPVDTVQPSIEIAQPNVEIEPVETVYEEIEPSQEVRSTVDTIQHPGDAEPPSMEVEQPPVELEHVEKEEPVEVEQPPEETVPSSQVQASAELVKPILEEPSDSRKFPVKPVLLLAMVLVAVIGIAYWSGMFDESTGGAGVGSIEPPEGIVSWWSGDGTAEDIIGENHGQLKNGISFSEGFVGDAFDFTASPHHVYATGEGIDDLEELTIEFWVKMDLVIERSYCEFVRLFPSKAVLRYDGHAGPKQLHFFCSIGWGGENLRHIRASNVLEKNQWYHVAGTYDGAIMRLYLDGEEIGNLTVSDTLETGDDLVIGSDGEFFDGMLDEISIYNRALSITEIRKIFEAGSNGKKKPNN